MTGNSRQQASRDQLFTVTAGNCRSSPDRDQAVPGNDRVLPRTLGEVQIAISFPRPTIEKPRSRPSRDPGSSVMTGNPRKRPGPRTTSDHRSPATSPLQPPAATTGYRRRLFRFYDEVSFFDPNPVSRSETRLRSDYHFGTSFRNRLRCQNPINDSVHILESG